MPGSTSARYLRMGTASLRQLSTTEKMAAILGPASLLPRCSQFFRWQWHAAPSWRRCFRFPKAPQCRLQRGVTELLLGRPGAHTGLMMHRRKGLPEPVQDESGGCHHLRPPNEHKPNHAGRGFDPLAAEFFRGARHGYFSSI
jgi:hypothetical protein